MKAKLEAWLGEPIPDFIVRVEHASKRLWDMAKGDKERREEFLRMSRGMARFASELREVDDEPEL